VIIIKSIIFFDAFFNVGMLANLVQDLYNKKRLKNVGQPPVELQQF